MVTRIAVTVLLLAVSAVAQNSRYLGQLSKNHYNPNSTSNPYGRYGSRYSFSSINLIAGERSAIV